MVTAIIVQCAAVDAIVTRWCHQQCRARLPFRITTQKHPHNAKTFLTHCGWTNRHKVLLAALKLVSPFTEYLYVGDGGRWRIDTLWCFVELQCVTYVFALHYCSRQKSHCAEKARGNCSDVLYILKFTAAGMCLQLE